jgi:hypothetical protein
VAGSDCAAPARLPKSSAASKVAFIGKNGRIGAG